MCRIICSVLALGFVGMIMAQDRTDIGGVKEITPGSLSAMLVQPNVHVIDVNEDVTYGEMHVPGAQHLEYDAISSAVLPPDTSCTLVFYCWSPECPASSMAALTAVRSGFTHVYFMPAGITGWQDAGLPTEP